MVSSLPQSPRGETKTIHNLPPEVLSKIFHSMTSDEAWVRPRMTQAPLLVCNISSHWRETALASPELWENLVVTFRDPSRVAWRMDMAKAWLARAKTRKISLWIFFFHMISANPIGEIIAPLENQISVLQLTSAPIGCLQSLFDLPERSLPLLRRLIIAFPPPHFSWARKASVDTQIFPHLEDFSISAGWSVLSVQCLPIQWAQLTTLRVEKAVMPLSVLCAILARCISLASCYLTIQTKIESHPPPPKNVITLTHLRLLSLQLTQGFDYFLGHFSLPKVSTVLVGTNPMTTLSPVAHTLHTALASSTLRRLATSMYVEPSMLLFLLEGSPNLRELRMYYDAEVIRALTLTSQSAQLIQHVSSLTIVLGAGGGTASAVSQIAQMVSMRWFRSQDLGRLRKLTLCTPKGHTEADSAGWDVALGPLETAFARGLELQVRSGNDLSFEEGDLALETED
ncbi:hypothetical protein C8F04DRAFT_1115562 [Mycena alexandri]|uniref:F-box domain-containing protein n=1 Tax=Mycena alexandri TaxID=1745969 RepID=A0AAD6SKU7_9AGAR|nr:hypothetical protein C8F04DRAFT_1115562 [Mycena alexandri]